VLITQKKKSSVAEWATNNVDAIKILLFAFCPTVLGKNVPPIFAVCRKKHCL